MKRFLALFLAVLMTVSFCCTGIYAADTVTVKFVDADGTELGTATVDPEVGLAEVPVKPTTGSDGFYYYAHRGWTVDGAEADPLKYTYTADVTFTAVIQRFGELFEESTPVDVTDTSAELNLMPHNVPINHEANGITWIYKVEGADTEIIADSLKVGCDRTNKTNGPASQWDTETYCSDDGYPYNFELNNGYYFLYVNDNLNNMNAYYSDAEVALFSIYGINGGYTNQRVPVNTNEAATVTMLAVIPDNLQPTVTLMGADGTELASYTHQYTNVTNNLGYAANGKQKSQQEGELITVADAVGSVEFTEPTSDSGAFIGWATAADATEPAKLSDMPLYQNTTLYPVFKTIADEDKTDIIFTDATGATLYTGKSAYGKLLSTDYPTTCDKAADGVYVYAFAGWSVDGKNVIDVENYYYDGVVTLVPVFNTYGEVYEDPKAIDITYTGSAINLLPAETALAPDNTGLTLVYKVEGADTEIIADDFRITVNTGNPAWQWADLTYNNDGGSSANLELNNGYYYIYINNNLFGAGKTSIKTVSIYNSHAAHLYNESTARDPLNENEAATFTMLAVVSNNLQPTLTVVNGEETLGSYTHQYTNVTSRLGFGTYRTSFQEGKLITVADAMAQIGTIEEPAAPEGTAFTGWALTEDAVKSDNLSEVYFYENTTLYPVFSEYSEEDYVDVTFLDAYGEELYNGYSVFGKLISEDYPISCDKTADGMFTYTFAGWSVDGKTVVDVDTYYYDGPVTFVPVYTTDGIVYEDPKAVDITYTGSAINLLPGEVTINPNYTGLTLVYKVEGADTEIIADDFRVTTNTGNPAWQWSAPSYSLDGMAPANLELNNGYYYIYMNSNVFGTGKTSIKTASIYNTHLEHYYDPNTARDPLNENDSATFTMLAVVSDNLQPTVSFVVDGVKTDYIHKYTNITTNIGHPAAGNKNSFQEGKLITLAEAVELSAIGEPTAPEGSVFVGWAKSADATDAENISEEYLYTNVTLYPVFKVIAEEDQLPVYFVNKDADVIYTGKSAYGKLLSTDWPTATDAPAADGVHMYKFAGWSVDGKTVVDPASYYYEGEVNFVPVFTVYGEIYNDPTPVDITDTSKEINLMTKPALINADAYGITWVYKVEGAESEIIADSLKVSSTATGNPAGQWNSLNYTSDGDYAYQFELNNGYYFLYVNDNLNNMNSLTTDVNYAKFSIYGTRTDGSGYTSARTPVNDNEAAKVTVLGVISDNLQPVVTFHDADGAEMGTYQHKYTDVTRHLGWGAGNPLSVQEGKLITGEQAFVASGLEAPAVPDGYVLYGWTDTLGGTELVEAIYDHIDLYPVYKEISEEDYVDVIFVDDSGNEVFTGASAFGKLMTLDYPTTCDKAHDGVYSYTFNGWSVDGENVVDPAFYEYDGVVTFKPVYTRYGVVYDDPAKVTLSGTTKTDLLTEDVTMGGYGTNGVTFVYYVEGVETEIIADDMYITYNNSAANARPAWQWADLGHNADGMGPANFELNNGYYYLYQNGNICGAGGGNGINEVTQFSIFNSHLEHYYTPDTVRDPVNENEAASVTMLAVIPDNLQPTVTFVNEGVTIGSYTHKYSDVHKNLGYSANVNSQIEGELLTPEEVYEAMGADAPTKAADENYVYVFLGWSTTEGGTDLVEAVYQNQTLYAVYDAVEKTTQHTVTFMNGDDVHAIADVYEQDVATAPETPAKEGTAEGEYTFAGWALEAEGEVVDLGSVRITEPTTFYAVYTYADVEFTVTYMHNNKTVYTETVVRSKDAVYAGVPTEATDPYQEDITSYYHKFAYWAVESVGEGGVVSLVKADLSNVQRDITVIAVFDYVPVTVWHDVTWVDMDGKTVLATAKVADGDGVATSAKGLLDGAADENVWYTFSGWDKETTVIYDSTTVTAVYSTTAVATGDMLDYKTETVSGPVGTQHSMWAEDITSFEKTYETLTIVVDIKGASEENPVSIGGAFTEANGSNSNSCAMMPNNRPVFNNITKDGKYFVTLGALVVGNNGWTINRVTTVMLDKTGGSRNPASVDASGAATYDSFAFMGDLKPEVKFYDAQGNWLYTGKYTYSTHRNVCYTAEVPTAADLYAGPEIGDFKCWVDEDGKEVTYVTNNMSVYVQTNHVHEWIATGAGTAECATCDETNDAAFTVIAGEATVADVKAGDTITVPVIVNNGTFVGLTLNVAVSNNVTLTDVDATGTLFEGYTVEFADGRIVLNAAAAGADITTDGTVINLILTAKADLAADEEVTVAVTVEEAVTNADAVITADIADGYTATYVASVTAADIMWGDVDGNGEINGQDAVLLTRYTSRWDESTYADAVDLQIAGDVDGNGEINGQDAVLLTRYTSRWDESTYADAVNLLKSVG